MGRPHHMFRLWSRSCPRMCNMGFEQWLSPFFGVALPRRSSAPLTNDQTDLSFPAVSESSAFQMLWTHLDVKIGRSSFSDDFNMFRSLQILQIKSQFQPSPAESVWPDLSWLFSVFFNAFPIRAFWDWSQHPKYTGKNWPLVAASYPLWHSQWLRTLKRCLLGAYPPRLGPVVLELQRSHWWLAKYSSERANHYCFQQPNLSVGYCRSVVVHHH